jgi:hypothetical protein
MVEKSTINERIKNFVLKAKEPIPGVKLLHKSISTIGKHYLFRKVD